MADKKDTNKPGQSGSAPVKIPTGKPVFTPTSQLEIKGLKNVTDKPTNKTTNKR